MKVVHTWLEDEVACIKVAGRLDAATVSVFEQKLQTVLNESHAHLIVDLADVSYISSSGLRALLTSRRQARIQGRALLVCCLSPRVRQVFDMIGFMSIFDVYDEVAQARQALDQTLATPLDQHEPTVPHHSS